MVPFGAYYNSEYLKLKRGDRVQFIGERKEKWYFVDRLEIGIETAAFSFWCRTLYSCNDRYGIPKETIFKRWELQAISKGFDEGAFSRLRCLIIEVRNEKWKNGLSLH